MTDKEKPKYTWEQKVGALRRQLRPYRRVIITLSTLGVIAAVVNGVVPYITGRFLDALVHPFEITLPYLHAVEGWTFLLGLWVFAQLIANGLSLVMERLGRRLSTEIQAGVQSRAFRHLITLPISFHKHHRTGDLTESINRASWMLDSMTGTVLSVAPQFLTLIIGIAISFAIMPMLALVLLGGVVAYVLALVRVVPPLASVQEQANETWNRAYGDAYDAFVNIQTVKHSGAELEEDRAIYEAFHGKAIPLWYKLERIWSNLNLAQRITVTITQAVIFILSVYLIGEGRLTIGELIAFNAYAGMIIGPFVSLGTQWQTLQNGLNAVARTETIFGTDPEIYEPENAIRLPLVRGDVEFSDVRFAYEEGAPEILKGITFQVASGQSVALVGETGAGKTTTMELVSAYYFPSGGTVRVDGHDIKTVHLRDLRSHIAVVPQEVVLFNGTILDNIRYGRPAASDEEVRDAARKARADSFIEKFPDKYEQVVGERGIKLSVGQKQRVAIARAILRDPRILILDEPTSALDPETERYITEQLEMLMRGRTTFIIAHRLSTVRKADKILVLKEGVIAEAGTHDELMAIADGVYRRLYDLHIGLHE